MKKITVILWLLVVTLSVAAQEQNKRYSAGLTKEMKGIVDAFVAQHPDWEPDEIKLTVKVLS